jgi:hypothetical protein
MQISDPRVLLDRAGNNNRTRTLQGEPVHRNRNHAHPVDVPECPGVGLVPNTPVSIEL